jgi:hypothetical protein
MALMGAELAYAGKHVPLTPAAKPTPPETALHAYIERVRAQQAAEVRTTGSIWSSGRTAGAAGHRRQGCPAARRGFRSGFGKPGGLDRRAGEKLPFLERQLRADRCSAN